MDKFNKQMTVKHSRAIEILSQHGIAPRTLTAVLNGEFVKNSSFVDHFGIKQYYVYRDLMDWLGY